MYDGVNEIHVLLYLRHNDNTVESTMHSSMHIYMKGCEKTGWIDEESWILEKTGCEVPGV